MAAKEYSIAFSLAAHLSTKFGSTFQSASQHVNQFNDHLAKLNSDVNKYDRLIKLRKDVALAAKANIQARQSVAELGRQMSASSKPSKELSAAFQTATVRLEKTKKALERKRKALREMDAALGTSGIHLKDLVKTEQELKASIDRVTQAQRHQLLIQAKLNRLNDKQRRLNEQSLLGFAKLAGYTATLQAGLGRPIAKAIELEDAMADVAKVVNFEQPDGLIRMQEALESMSLRIPMTASGLAQIAAAAGQAGIPAKDLLAFTEQAAKMGVAYDITAQEAGEMMAKWRSGMGLTQEQVNRLADATNALSNSNAAQARQIGGTLQRYGALGKVAGLTELQTAALAATVISSGAEAEVAATGINAFMRSLSRGSSMTARQALAFRNVGFDPTQLQRELQADAPKAILSVLNSIKGKVPKELQMEYLTAMFGDEGARAMGPLLTNTELLAENFKLISDEALYTQSMLKEFEARSATTSNALTLLSSASDLVIRALGRPFLGVIKENAKGVIQWVGSFGKWISEHSDLVLAISSVGGSVLALGAVFQVARIAMWVCLSPVLFLAKGFTYLRNSELAATIATKAWSFSTVAASKIVTGLTIGVRGLGIALRFAFLNPVGLAITAVAGLIAAGVALYKNWDIVKAKATSVWSGIQAAAKGPINTVIGWINKLIELVNKIRLPKWLGGGEAGITQIPQLANGGIATGASLAMVGEGGEPEAILPLSKLSTMLNQPKTKANSGISVHYAPVIQISGTGNVRQDVEQGLRAGNSDLRRELERLLNHELRLSY